MLPEGCKRSDFSVEGDTNGFLLDMAIAFSYLTKLSKKTRNRGKSGG
jgi:hypothetical protein